MKTIETVACHKCGKLHALYSEDLVLFNGSIRKIFNDTILDGEYPFCIQCLIMFLREELQSVVFRQ